MSSHKSQKITHFVDLLMIIFNGPLKLETINSSFVSEKCLFNRKIDHFGGDDRRDVENFEIF